MLISEKQDVFNWGNCKKVLILRHDRIGDVLVTMPLLKHLRSKQPNIQIDILLSINNKSISSSLSKYISNVYIYDKKIISIAKLILQLKFQKYDLIIDGFDNYSRTSAKLISLINPKFSLGIKKSEKDFYTHSVAAQSKLKTHIVDRTSSLLLAFDINPKDVNLDLEFPIDKAAVSDLKQKLLSTGKSKIIGINLAGSDRDKFWGVEPNIAFIKLIEENYPDFLVQIFASSEYESELSEIISQTNAIAATKTTSFEKYAEQIATCDVLVTSDTAAVHLASAFKIPCLAMYVFKNDERFGMPWTPFNVLSEVIYTGDKLINIHYQNVFASFQKIMKKIA